MYESWTPFWLHHFTIRSLFCSGSSPQFSPGLLLCCASPFVATSPFLAVRAFHVASTLALAHVLFSGGHCTEPTVVYYRLAGEMCSPGEKGVWNEKEKDQVRVWGGGHARR